MYPVVTLSGSLTHHTTRKNWLGSHPHHDAIKRYSVERRVSASTPPTFLAHALDDTIVKVQNAHLFRNACRQHAVPCEYLELSHGGHAFVTRELAWNRTRSAFLAWIRSLS